MADLFREVDEAMRQERIEKFWQENRNYIIGFIVGTVLLTAILSGYRAWNAGVQQDQTAAVIALQEASDYPENILKTEKLKLRAGLRGVALLQAAGEFLNQDKTEQAIALYQRAAADSSIPDELQHLGILMSVRLLGDQEDQKGEDLLKALRPALKSNSPWLSHARLEAAVINAHKLGDYETAIKHLNEVQDTTGLPESLYERARALNHLYTMELQNTAPAETG